MNMSQGPPVPPQDNGGGRGMCTRCTYYQRKPKLKFMSLVAVRYH